MDIVVSPIDPTSMQRELERFVQHLGHSKPSMVAFGRGRWEPMVDLYETGDEVVVLVELAGVAEDQVEVWVDGDILAIRGVRQSCRRGTGQEYHIMEVQTGPFERVIRLPSRVAVDRGTAHSCEGFIELVFPKAEDPVATKVNIVPR